jgi:hypothetical protein
MPYTQALSFARDVLFLLFLHVLYFLTTIFADLHGSHHFTESDPNKGRGSEFGYPIDYQIFSHMAEQDMQDRTATCSVYAFSADLVKITTPPPPSGHNKGNGGISFNSFF